VNQSISDRYFERYGIRAVVVRNISPKITIDLPASKEALHLPLNIPLLIMQGAGLNVDRGVEEAINAMHFIDSAKLIIVGDGDIIPQMKEKVIHEELTDKVFFYGKRPYKELMQFTYHATIGLSFDQPTNPNYLYSLPNKIFDYIHTQTPILCSNVVEVKKIVEQYAIGKVVASFEPKALASEILTILNNQEQLEQWRKNCIFASEQEQWDKEVSRLAEFYPTVN
jgi:glycosyltransferase involved in cell wall biosynthesis